MGLSAVWLVFCEGLIGKLSFCSGLERLSESLSMGDNVTENASIQEGSGWARLGFGHLPPLSELPTEFKLWTQFMVLGITRMFKSIGWE